MRFGTKMTIAFILTLALAFGVGGSLLISTSASGAANQAREASVASHRLVLYTLSAISAGSQSSEHEQAREALAQLDAQGGGWVSLRLSSGDEVLFISGPPDDFTAGLSESVNDDTVAMLMTRRGARYLLQIAGQVTLGSGALCLECVYDVTPVFESRTAQVNIYHQLFIVIVALGGAVSWLMSFLMTRPLRRLSRVTRVIASGDLTGRADVRGRDEISVLASDFNDMAARLEANITELRDTMERQEAFMGGVAHELKTPMTSIIGYADLLRGHSLSEDDRREAANYIFTEGRRLEVLSLKLLDLIVLKRRDFTFLPGNIKTVVLSAAKLLRPTLQSRNIRLTHRCQDVICVMESDLIMSLLLNLIDNARKAFDDGGNILVEATGEDGMCVLHVTDNGKGIPEHDLEKIKDAFYRVEKSRSRSQGGVGLGLALCEEIVMLHGGTISFESELGKGTRVTVTLKGEQL